MKILIVEPVGSGHHMSHYLKNYLLEAKKRNFSISLLTTQEALDSEGFKLATENAEYLRVFLLNGVKFRKKLGTLEAIFKNFLWWFNVRKAYKSLSDLDRPDIIFIPSIDFFAKALSLLGSPFDSVPLYGLEISPKLHLRKELKRNYLVDFIYRFLFQKLVNNSKLLNLFVIDNFFYDFLKKIKLKNKNKIIYVPDFNSIEQKIDKEKARNILGVSLDDKLVLVYGSISKRKGILEILDSVKSFKNKKKLRIIFAGKPEDLFLEELKKKYQENIELKDVVIERLYHHDSYEESVVFSATDVVWLGYKDFFGSSGVLYQSLDADKPILSSDNGLIGKFVVKNNVGLTFDINSKKEIVSSMEKIFKEENYFSFIKNLKKIALENSLESHIKIIFDTIDSKFQEIERLNFKK